MVELELAGAAEGLAAPEIIAFCRGDSLAITVRILADSRDAVDGPVRIVIVGQPQHSPET